jgi:hypothetical protein
MRHIEISAAFIGDDFVPRSSFGRASLGKDDGVNKLFLTYLFIDMDLGIQFLMDVGLIRSKVTVTLAAAM